MRHNYKGRKLGTDWSHTQAMKKSLVRALFENDRIKTIDVRAKEIRGDVDRIITWAKRGDLHSRRLAYETLNDHKLVQRLFDVVAPLFAGVPGGYTRITKMALPRKGDCAPMAILEFTRQPEAAAEKN